MGSGEYMGFGDFMSSEDSMGSNDSMGSEDSVGSGDSIGSEESMRCGNLVALATSQAPTCPGAQRFYTPRRTCGRRRNRNCGDHGLRRLHGLQRLHGFRRPFPFHPRVETVSRMARHGHGLARMCCRQQVPTSAMCARDIQAVRECATRPCGMPTDSGDSMGYGGLAECCGHVGGGEARAPASLWAPAMPWARTAPWPAATLRAPATHGHGLRRPRTSDGPVLQRPAAALYPTAARCAPPTPVDGQGACSRVAQHTW